MVGYKNRCNEKAEHWNDGAVQEGLWTILWTQFFVKCACVYKSIACLTSGRDSFSVTAICQSGLAENINLISYSVHTSGLEHSRLPLFFWGYATHAGLQFINMPV